MSNPSEKGVGDDGSWLEAQDAREGEGVAETSAWGGQCRGSTGLILIMESVQVKRSIFPSAHVFPTPPNPFPCRVYLSAAPFAAPPSPRSSFWSWGCLQFQFRAISSPPSRASPSPSRHPFPPAEPPSGWSLFNIDFLSKGRKYRENIELHVAALTNVKPCRLFNALQRSTEGDGVAQMYAECSPA
jgi:hypothetical protein